MFKTGGDERRGKGRESERETDRRTDGWMDGRTDRQTHKHTAGERERKREITSLTWEWHAHWPHQSQKSWCQRSHRSIACAGWPQTDDHPAKLGCRGLVLQSADWVGSPHPPSQSAPWLLLPSLYRKETSVCFLFNRLYKHKFFLIVTTIKLGIFVLPNSVNFLLPEHGSLLYSRLTC